MVPHRFGTTLVLSAVLLFPPVLAAQQHGVDKSYFDTTCAPCTDFFTFATGGWMKTATIPAAYTNTGTFRELSDRNTDALHEVLDDVLAHARTLTDPTQKKLGAYYATCMDSSRADKDGAAPLKPELQRIDGIKSRADLLAEIARLHGMGVGAAFAFRVGADPKESSVNLGRLNQGGLGLPDRDYYLRHDPASDSLRQKYQAHVARTLALLGAKEADAEADAGRILALETALAESSMTRVAQRDPDATYHKMSMGALGTLAPGVNWRAYFTARGAAALADTGAMLNVAQPHFAWAVAREIETAPLETWRAYLRWHLANAAANWLGRAFFDEAFSFQSVLTGVKEPLPLWKRCAGATDGAMGEALGQAYVAREFSPESKARVLEMVNNLQAVMRERIGSNPWMSESTKVQAVVKLDAVLKKIGYPDHWRDYTALQVSASQPFILNSFAARTFDARRNIGELGKPVDRSQWGMTPPTVNAYYNPTVNEIVFPAGILQPPFFDPQADDATNYGAAGAVIGHEMTHGFDDQGRKYDAQGNLKDWWTADDARQFSSRAQRAVDEYSSFVGVDTFHVNGQLTLGENLADIGGLTIAYHAYERSLEGKPHPAPVDGFTAEQRFFLSFAGVWRRITRPEALKLQVRTDPHSPAQWRVNGTVQNMPEFAAAWGCKTGDAMVRPDSLRVQIW